MVRKKIPVISLFCGCGGMDLGFRQQGFDPVIAIDNDRAAVETYNKNHRAGVAQLGDISSLSDRNIIQLIEKHGNGVRPQGVIGGPPCQSFSQGNAYSNAKDPRHKLPLHYAYILKGLNKKYHLDFFVFENVVGLKSKMHRERFHTILCALEDAGFNIFENELNASRFGVPQSRKRIIVVGINKELYPHVELEFPLAEEISIRTVRDAISGLPPPAFFSRMLKRDDIPYHPNHWTMQPKSSKFKHNLNKHNGRSFRRLQWDKPSWTVAYGHNEIHVHPNGNRRLSIFEAMRLQGFPDHYELLGNLTQQVKQVSDAVPPPMSSAIARALQKSIYNLHKRIQKKLLKWFRENQRNFSWRETNDPYAILIAEKLLQQTSANQAVITAYEKVLSIYPNIEELALANVVDIEPIVAPLGFKYRASELPALARKIVLRFGGKIPDDLRELLDLPGVGDYIARAVLCFGYGKAVPIVDTNVARFLYRVFGIEGHLPSNPARKRTLIDLASNLIPPTKVRDFNLAILDLCALICAPKNPQCKKCPIRENCVTGRLFSPD